jgi:hypothetical protein
MSIRIIDNKKVEITDDEWTMYNSIAHSYDRQNFKGEDLFKDLFETNDKGIIVFLRPPSVRQVSMEVVCFLQILMMHQHIRLMENKMERLCAKVEDKLKSISDKTAETK